MSRRTTIAVDSEEVARLRAQVFAMPRSMRRVLVDALTDVLDAELRAKARQWGATTTARGVGVRRRARASRA